MNIVHVENNVNIVDIVSFVNIMNTVDIVLKPGHPAREPGHLAREPGAPGTEFTFLLILRQMCIT